MWCARIKVELEIFVRGGTPLLIDNMPVEQNPLGKIPALERAGGPAIYDSRVITRYIAAQGAGNLYPEARIWEVLTLEATADGIMEAAVLMVYEGRVRPEDKQYPEWIEAQWLKVSRSLDALEERWMSHLAGPLDAAQIAVGCALPYLDFRHGDRDWRAGRPPPLLRRRHVAVRVVPVQRAGVRQSRQWQTELRTGSPFLSAFHNSGDVGSITKQKKGEEINPRPLNFVCGPTLSLCV